MPFVKALIPGTILTFVICLILGSNGTSAGWLEVHRITLQGQDFYWSWPFFVAATGLSWALFWMME